MKNSHAPQAQNPQTAAYADLLPNGKTVTVTLTAEETCAIFAAYDYGIDTLNEATLESLEHAIASLKFKLWN